MVVLTTKRMPATSARFPSDCRMSFTNTAG